MKGADEARRVAVVRTALEAVYAFTHFLAPVIPVAGQGIFDMLHTAPVSAHNLRADFYNLMPGTPVSVGQILFQKLEVETGGEAAAAAAPVTAKGKAADQKKLRDEVEEHSIDFTKLELRVGRVAKVWPHETSERLFCEDVDLGELGGGVRQIASGLRGHYTAEELQDRLVVVVCNLKESKFQGFMSNGMILAAKAADGSRVELVTPPAGSIVGERVNVGGTHTLAKGLPAAQVKKLKVWETVSAELRTNETLSACWKGQPMTTSAGPCVVSSLSDAIVS